MKHVSESAGKILITEVPTALPSATASSVEWLLKSPVADFKTINYIYIVDEGRQLLGVVSIKELLLLPESTLLKEVMKVALVTARVHTDQERVVDLALKSGLKAIPVIDRTGIFMGVVPSDTILSVLHHEHTEDVMHAAGIHQGHAASALSSVLLTSSPLAHVKLRLPWLVLGLGGGVVAAVVVGYFEATLAEQLILAAFIPAIVYMADAVGSQTQTLFIRALTIERDLKVGAYLRRELVVNFMLGIILSALAFGFSYLWLTSLAISSILGLSIFLTVWGTVLIAIALPYFFHRRGLDPAVASGPLATVVRDIMSLCIYLLVATAIL